MSTKVIKYISVCLLVLAFGALGTGVAQAALTANATALTSDGVLTITGNDVSVWSVASAAADDNLTVSVTGATASSLILSSAGTGANAMQITTSAGGLDISVTGTAAGEDLDITTVGATTEMRLTSASTEADAIAIQATTGAGGIDIDAGTGGIDLATTAATGDAFDIDANSITTADVFDINSTALTDGDVIDIAAPTTRVAGSALKITDASVAATVTGDLIQIDVTGTPDTNTLDIDITGVVTATSNAIDITYATGVGLGNAIDLNMGTNVAGDALNIGGAATTGDAIEITPGTARTSGSAIKITDASAAAAVTDALVQIDVTGTPDTNTIDIDITGVVEATSNALDITYATGVGLGNAIDLNMGTNVAGDALNIGGAATTGDAIEITPGTARTSGSAILITDASIAATVTGDLVQIDVTGTPDTNTIDIDVTGIATATSNAIDITYATVAALGNAIDLNMGTNLAGQAIDINLTGARTDDGINIDDDSTGNTPVLDMNISGIRTGNAIDITYATAAATENAIDLNMGTNLAGQAIDINLTGARTDDGINIDDDSTGNTPVLDMNISGIRTGNAIDITYATSAATENAIDLNMGTNVEGMAISISSAATGTSAEGSALDVLHTGALVAGADVVSIDTTGNISATSNVLSVTQRTGAGTAGAYAVYISATGANVEGLKVDDGTSAFDEAVTVTTAAVGTAPFTVTGLDNQTAAVLDLNVNNVSGTLIDVDYTAETQTGDLTGLDLNLNTNVTSATDQDVTGVNVQTPALTATDTSVTTTYTGYNISAAGTLSTTDGGVGAAVINWRGANITIPALTANTGDTVTGTGILVAAGTVTNGAGTETAIGIDVSDTDIVTALSIGANTILSDGTVTFNRAATGTVTLTATDDDANAALTVSSGGTGTLTLDGGGASAIVVGSADVTSLTAIVDNDVIIQNGATGNVTMDFRDYADTADDDMAHVLMTVNCTDATTGAEDCDLTIGVVEAGAAANTRFQIDADAGITIGSSANNSIDLTTDGTGDAEVVLPASSVTAGEIADIARGVNIGLTEFIDCETDAGALIGFDTTADALADYVNSATDGTGFVIRFDDTGGSLDQNTSICANLTVPPDYASGGEFRIRAVKDAHAGNAETFSCQVSINGAALGAANTVTTSAAASTTYTCTPAGTYAANDSVSFAVELSATTIDDIVDVASVEYVYTATE